MNPSACPIGVAQWTLREASYERAFHRVATAGYRHVELFADPAGPPAAAIDRMLADAGLSASSLCAMYDTSRDCAHPDRTMRDRAAAYLRASLELGGELGVRTLVYVPTYRVEALAARADEMRWAAQTIGEALDAVRGGPTVAIEPLNRYETHLVNTLDDAEGLRAAIGQEQATVMGDLFHMNIEEENGTAPLYAHARHLGHIHLADSNRRQPGAGHLDFCAVGAALHDIGFAGTMSMEFLPADDHSLRCGLAHVRRALAHSSACPA